MDKIKEFFKKQIGYIIVVSFVLLWFNHPIDRETGEVNVLFTLGIYPVDFIFAVILVGISYIIQNRKK